jgi:hypothetical protein
VEINLGQFWIILKLVCKNLEDHSPGDTILQTEWDKTNVLVWLLKTVLQL